MLETVRNKPVLSNESFFLKETAEAFVWARIHDWQASNDYKLDMLPIAPPCPLSIWKGEYFFCFHSQMEKLTPPDLWSIKTDLQNALENIDINLACFHFKILKHGNISYRCQLNSWFENKYFSSIYIKSARLQYIYISATDSETTWKGSVLFSCLAEKMLSHFSFA